MKPSVQQYLENQLSIKIQRFLPISGGDISSAFRLVTSKGSFFIKLNSSLSAYDMFKKEEKGLNLIAQTKTIHTPKVYGVFQYSEISIIVMSFINSRSPSPETMNHLGVQLRKLHECLSDSFGLHHDNYIGTLIQINKKSDSWEEFYTKRRIMPQIDIALKHKLLSPEEVPEENLIQETVFNLCGNIRPGLIHGDLWSGNYLIGENGTPYLIDPAIYYGHGEVDIAMSRLFGGFHPSFYNAYFKDDLEFQQFEKRQELYQLYYLLVHLNLFGMGYYNSVKKIMNKLFT